MCLVAHVAPEASRGGCLALTLELATGFGLALGNEPHSQTRKDEGKGLVSTTWFCVDHFSARL